jgi:hypothetical protein
MYDAYQNSRQILYGLLGMNQVLYFYILCSDIRNHTSYNDTFFVLNNLFHHQFYIIIGKKTDNTDEIDDHFRLYGKEPWEVDYGEKCPICNVRIDEYGFCSCGASGD